MTVIAAAAMIKTKPPTVTAISRCVFFCPKNQIPVNVAKTTDVCDRIKPVANPFIFGCAEIKYVRAANAKKNPEIICL